MNDRFKFRVWDKENKCFIRDNSYPIGSDYSLVLNQNGELFRLGLGDYNCSDIHSWGIFKKCKNFEVNFCTGLKDRNKKDVYENDIIKNRETGVYYQIIWNDEATAFMAKSKNNTISTYVLFSDYPYSIEIIGNIYTTPELLEGKS